VKLINQSLGLEEKVTKQIPECINSDNHTDVKSIVTKILVMHFLIYSAKGKCVWTQEKYCDLNLKKLKMLSLLKKKKKTGLDKIVQFRNVLLKI